MSSVVTVIVTGWCWKCTVVWFAYCSCPRVVESSASPSLPAQNYDCGFFTVRFVRVPFSIGVHVHVVNKAAETQSTDRSVRSNRKTLLLKETCLIMIYIITLQASYEMYLSQINIIAESLSHWLRHRVNMLLPAAPDTWVYFLPVDVSSFSWALCSNNSPAADTPQLRLAAVCSSCHGLHNLTAHVMNTSGSA